LLCRVSRTESPGLRRRASHSTFGLLLPNVWFRPLNTLYVSTNGSAHVGAYERVGWFWRARSVGMATLCKPPNVALHATDALPPGMPHLHTYQGGLFERLVRSSPVADLWTSRIISPYDPVSSCDQLNCHCGRGLLDRRVFHARGGVYTCLHPRTSTTRAPSANRAAVGGSSWLNVVLRSLLFLDARGLVCACGRRTGQTSP